MLFLNVLYVLFCNLLRFIPFLSRLGIKKPVIYIETIRLFADGDYRFDVCVEHSGFKGIKAYWKIVVPPGYTANITYTKRTIRNHLFSIQESPTAPLTLILFYGIPLGLLHNGETLVLPLYRVSKDFTLPLVYKYQQSE